MPWRLRSLGLHLHPNPGFWDLSLVLTKDPGVWVQPPFLAGRVILGTQPSPSQINERKAPAFAPLTPEVPLPPQTYLYPGPRKLGPQPLFFSLRDQNSSWLPDNLTKIYWCWSNALERYTLATPPSPSGSLRHGRRDLFHATAHSKPHWLTQKSLLAHWMSLEEPHTPLAYPWPAWNIHRHRMASGV